MAQYWGLKSDDERDKMLENAWLDDTLTDLILKLLNKDTSITGPVHQALQTALEKYALEVVGWEKMNHNDKAKYVLLDFGDRMYDVVKAAGKLLGWVGKIWQAGRQKVASWLSNTQAVADAIQQVLIEKPIHTGKRMLFTSLMFVVSMAAFAVTIWVVTNK